MATKTTERLKVALYARVSSQSQDVDNSIAAQLRTLRDYADSHGHTAVAEFSDEAKSGFSFERPEFNRMIDLAMSRDKPFDAILVWKFSRFARNREMSVIHKAQLRRKGVNVISINEQTDDSPIGKMIEGLIELMDEFYSENLSQDVRRGMAESARQGNFLPFEPPYGYDRLKEEVEGRVRPRTLLRPNPGEARVVKKIYRLCNRGWGLKRIADFLNGQGIPYKQGKVWTINAVSRVLRDPANRGILVWGKVNKAGSPPIVVKDAWEPIVSQRAYNVAKALLLARQPDMALLPPSDQGNESFSLRGFLHCGMCGKAYLHLPANGNGGAYLYYVCGTQYRSGSSVCGAPRLSAEKLHWAIEAEVGTALSLETLPKIISRVVVGRDHVEICYPMPNIPHSFLDLEELSPVQLCEVCGASCDSQSSARFCSNTCKMRALKRRQRERRPLRFCEDCGACLGRRRGNTFCGWECRDLAYKRREQGLPALANIMRRFVQEERPLRFCDDCGACLEALRSDARFCSKTCRAQGYLRRKKGLPELANIMRRFVAGHDSYYVQRCAMSSAYTP